MSYKTILYNDNVNVAIDAFVNNSMEICNVITLTNNICPAANVSRDEFRKKMAIQSCISSVELLSKEDLYVISPDRLSKQLLSSLDKNVGIS